MKNRKIPSLRLLLAALVGTLALALSACNTVEGVGEDVEAAGEEVEETAQEAN